MAENAVDMKGMFEAKMGFSADDVPLDDEQLEKFLMLCHQSYLESEGLMGDGQKVGDYEEELDDGKMKVKVIKLHNGDAHGIMDKILGGR